MAEEKKTTTRKKAAATDVQPTEEKKDTPFDKFLEHQRKAFEEATKALEGLIPGEFREHSQAAFKEVVEGYRSLFNSTLDEVVAAIEKARFTDKKED